MWQIVLILILLPPPPVPKTLATQAALTYTYGGASAQVLSNTVSVHVSGTVLRAGPVHS